MIARSKKASLEEKILITGAGGQLGYELSQRLGERATSKPREAMDVTDIWKMREWLPVLRPDMIVHCAAYTDPIKAEREPTECWNVNALATHAMAVIANRIKCPFLYISTDMVFGAFTNMYGAQPFGEKYPVGPLNVLGQSKAAAEHAILQAQQPKDDDEDAGPPTPYWILRTAQLYERPWRTKHNFPQQLLQRAGRQTPMSLPTDTFASSTYVPHLAEAIMLIIENRDSFPSGTYHVTNSGHCSLYDLGREFAAGLPKPPRIEPIQHDLYYSRQNVSPLVMPRYSVLTTKKFDDLTPRPLPSWQDAVEEYHRELKRLS